MTVLQYLESLSTACKTKNSRWDRLHLTMCTSMNVSQMHQ